MEHHLVLSAVGEDRPGIVNALSQAVFAGGCNILDSRMTVLGGEFAVILLVSGTGPAIAALEAGLGRLQTELGMTIISKRTDLRQARADQRPYQVRAVAIDHPGIVHRIAGFFSERGINIESLSTERYPAALTGTPMFALSMVVNVPARTKIAALRNQFIAFSDDLNIDAAIEPAQR